MTRHRIVPFFIPHAGCPHRCLFCNQETVAPPLPLALVAERIRCMLAALPSGDSVECAFYGGSFAALPRQERQRLLDVVHHFLRQGRVLSIRISTRPDSLTPEVVDELAAAGVGTVELGVQSLDDEVLALSRRGHGARCVEEACRLLRAAGLTTGLQLMPGLPGDTRERALATMERAIALGPDFFRIYPTLVLEGTELADHYRQGSYRPLSLEGAVDLCKGLLLRARRAAIPVIRVGVQATELLDAPGTVLAGPYHPAFRQLVESALYGDLLLKLLRGAPADCDVRCHPSRLSDLVGQGRANIRRAAASGFHVRPLPDPEVADGELRVTVSGREVTASLLRDLDC
jgi:histone acetyltransferase (RNA polymerase elongator complex component)